MYIIECESQWYNYHMLAKTMKEALLYKKYNTDYDCTISKYDINDFMVIQQTLEELKETYKQEKEYEKSRKMRIKKEKKEFDKYLENEQKKHLKYIKELQKKEDNVQHPEIDWWKIAIEIHNKTYLK